MTVDCLVPHHHLAQATRTSAATTTTTVAMKIIAALPILCGLVPAAVHAFSTSNMKALRNSQRLQSSSTTLFVGMMHPRQLSEIDLMALENVAEFCLSVDSMVEECDLDEHEALVNQLSEQRNILLQQRANLDGHVHYLDNVLARLIGHQVAGHSLNENEIMYDH
jgi:hypothetical protein